MSTNGILDPDTQPNFIEAYMYAIGQSEVPVVYHLWSAYSLIAACLGREAWHEKSPTNQLFPNLFTFLIGASGSGKNQAIDFAYDLAKPVHDLIGPYRGNITAKGLLDLLGKPVKRRESTYRHIEQCRPIYILTPELAMAVGQAKYADSLIKHMTELYSGKDYPLGDTNRTRGTVIVQGALINWLAGTVEEWLIESVPRTAIEGGFFARCVPVLGKRDFSVRLTKPLVPSNYHAVVDYLQRQLERMCNTGGKFIMMDEAIDIDDAWYQTRPAPVRDDMQATWIRQQDLVYKLAMLNSVADDPTSGVIEGKHIQLAQRLSQIVLHNAPKLIDLASLTPLTSCAYEVERFIEKRGRVPHIALLRGLSRRYAAQQIIEAEQALKEQGRIHIFDDYATSSTKGERRRKSKWLMWITPGKLGNIAPDDDDDEETFQ